MAARDYMLGTLGSEVLMSGNEANFELSIENLAQEVRLATGQLVRYKQAQMLHWMWRYAYLPGKTTYVYDGGMGRNALFALYQADAEVSYLVPGDTTPQVAYTVRFAMQSWKEQIVFKSGDFWAYRLSFELVQTK